MKNMTSDGEGCSKKSLIFSTAIFNIMMDHENPTQRTLYPVFLISSLMGRGNHVMTEGEGVEKFQKSYDVIYGRLLTGNTDNGPRI